MSTWFVKTSWVVSLCLLVALLLAVYAWIDARVSLGYARQEQEFQKNREEPSEVLVQVYPRVCNPGLHSQPNGPFAVFVFCDDGLGSTIGVINDELRVLFGGPWSLADRFWQERSWARDVMSFAWSTNGNRLYVATQEIYGVGALFELNLEARTALQVSPTEGVTHEITKVDEEAGVLHYSPGDRTLEFPSSEAR